MGNILFLKKGLVHTAPSPWPASFADATWEQIIAACQRRNVPDSWLVGDSKPMTIYGNDYRIDIIGKTHDVYADGSGTAPLTFQMHDCYGTTIVMNSTGTNVGGWTDCHMRSTGLPSIKRGMPPEVQAALKKVNKLTSKGNQISQIIATSDDLFLLSEVEVFGDVTYSLVGEGAQYEYYAAGNSTVKNRDGAAIYWWERSPRLTNATSFCIVSTSGAAGSASGSASRGVACAFCF